MVLCLGEPSGRFLLLFFIFVLHFAVVLHFIFDLHFVVVLHLSFFFIRLLFDIIPHPSVDYRWVFTPILYFHDTLSFSTFPGSSYRERYGFESAFFTHRRFLPYAPSPTFLTQPAFIKTSLGVGSSSLTFAGPHTDPRNVDPAHLFV